MGERKGGGGIRGRRGYRGNKISIVNQAVTVQSVPTWTSIGHTNTREIKPRPPIMSFSQAKCTNRTVNQPLVILFLSRAFTSFMDYPTNIICLPSQRHTHRHTHKHMIA